MLTRIGNFFRELRTEVLPFVFNNDLYLIYARSYDNFNEHLNPEISNIYFQIRANLPGAYYHYG